MEVACRYGIFEIMSKDDLISKSLIEYGEWAQIEIDILCKFIKQGDTVIDAGAYIGTHTIAFSNIVGNSGKVISFEPNPTAFKILENNCALNSCNNIMLYSYALGNIEKQVTLLVNKNDNLGGSYLSDLLNKESNKQIIVDQRKLDSFLNEPIHFIKADVEGMELELLNGSENLIAEYKPVVFLEVISLQNSAPILEWAKKFGYIVYGIITSAYNEKNYNLSSKNIFGEARECGLLLVHSDMLYKYEDGLYVHNLPKIETVDDLALLLLHKPQYPYEVLSTSKSALKLGINYPSPKIESLENEVATKNSNIQELNSKIKSLENEVISVLLSRSWRYTRPLRKIANRLRNLKRRLS